MQLGCHIVLSHHTVSCTLCQPTVAQYSIKKFGVCGWVMLAFNQD